MVRKIVSRRGALGRLYSASSLAPTSRLKSASVVPLATARSMAACTSVSSEALATPETVKAHPRFFDAVHTAGECEGPHESFAELAGFHDLTDRHDQREGLWREQRALHGLV